MNPSPVTPPYSPDAQRAALAVQIGALTHTVDRLERAYGDLGQNAAVGIALGLAIIELHAAIDGLNALYEADLNDASEHRRAKWLLRDILRDLPVNKDWLNPDTERAARALVGN